MPRHWHGIEQGLRESLKTKGEARFQGNRHGFQDRSDEPGGKLAGNYG
jgi:hypothetical protein